MILNTGSRTDIPAFYSEWFMNRIHEGFVMARNPYYPRLIHKYVLDPHLIDVLVFCTKNPEPMLKHMKELKDYRMIWNVTITPYGKDIEPNVPDKYQVIEAFRQLSERVGSRSIFWRYDPIFLNERYDLAYHLKAFEKICTLLEGYTDKCIISFIDLYEKTKRNFPEVREVEWKDQIELTSAFVKIAERHGIRILTCLEASELENYGADSSGCLSQTLIEDTLSIRLKPKKHLQTRQGCNCLLGNDIGAYNSCGHLCRYCYANYDRNLVLENMKRHDPGSPLLIGNIEKDDEIREVKQESWIDEQITLFL